MTVWLIALISPFCLAQSDGKLQFLDQSVYSELKASLSAPPTMDSKAQKADELEISHLISKRKDADCTRAHSEIEATLGNFFGAPNGPLSKDQVTRLDDFFKVLRNEAGAFIGKVKAEFVRQRPYQYMKDVTTCIKQETSNAYPSGHAIFAELYSLVLIDFFPDKKSQILLRSDQIGRDRVLTGLHHPSDIVGGRQVGRKIYDLLKKSKSFNEAFAKAKASL